MMDAPWIASAFTSFRAIAVSIVSVVIVRISWV
jgi:hypothetical protein